MVIVVTILGVLVAIMAALYGLYKYKNRRIKPDYYETFKTQDTVPVGKVGVFVSAHIQGETIEPYYWYNMSNKMFKNVIPWPFRILARADNGIALLDPVKFYEYEEFVPTKLVDPWGSDCDLDGVPYIDRYKQGQVVWVPPTKMIHKSSGGFCYKGRKGGMPTRTGKSLATARIWYYDKGIKQKKIPHAQGTYEVINAAFAKIWEKHGEIEWRAESFINHYGSRKKVHELLDAACDTIVLVAPWGVYSHFEDFNSGFYHFFEYLHAWEQEHPGKKTKVIMAPPMGQFKPLRQAYLEMLKDRLDTLPEGSDVAVAVTVHGMPWDAFWWEAWLELAPIYRDTLFAEVKDVIKSYNFGRTNVTQCQDEFADPVWDPKDKYLSTNQAYWNLIKDGYDYIIGLPIEFTAENSDTMYHHALKNYDGFDDYSRYNAFDYPDWSVPFTMEFQQGKTRIIYNGVPVGKYQPYVTDAFFQAIDSILVQKKVK
jgi:protoheme ferro-lyase